MNRVYVVSIRDRSLDEGYLTFDLKDVLAALGDRVWQWTWCVLELDAIGHEIEPFCQSVDSQPNGFWVDTAEFLMLADRIVQTISAQFLAFRRDVDRTELQSEDLNSARFPQNEIQLVIRAVDSSYFEVYAKEESIVRAINSRFSSVFTEDEADYFDWREAE
jgi:hypothetical protein